MKSIKLFVSIFVFVSLFIISNTVFALTTNTKVPDKLTPVIDSNLPKAVLVATVNIVNPKIISQENNNFKISFDLTNREGLQSGVKYGLQLIGESTKGQFIADEKVYPESLTLYENSSVHKEISYIAPPTLSGDYTLVLNSKNASGFPFGIAMAGKVKLASSGTGIIINTESCYLNINEVGVKTKYNLSQGVDITTNETLLLNCEAVNLSDKEVSSTVNFETTLRTLYGDVVETKGVTNEPIIFKGKEKKSIIIVLPKASNPQAYDIKVSLKSLDSVSNTVVVHYVLSGVSSTIQNISLDKDYYKNGENAILSFIWASRADNFPGSRAGKSNLSPKLTAVIKDSKGILCAETLNQDLKMSTTPRVEIPILINKDCLNPNVSLVLKDSNGTVLDEKGFSIESKSLIDTKKAEDKNTIYIVFSIILLLLIAAGLMYFKKKKDNGKVNSIPLQILFPFLLLLAFGSIAPSSADASTFIVGSREGYFADVVVNVTTGDIYEPGQEIKIEGSMIYEACSNTTTNVNLVASVWGFGAKKYIVNNTSIIGNGSVMGGITLVAPEEPNAYGLYFEATLGNETSSFAHTFWVTGDPQCGTDLNSCDKSYYSDDTDTNLLYKWFCNGYANGKSVSCSLAIPKLDGKCSLVESNKCVHGFPSNINSTKDAWTWDCVGSGQGLTTSCSMSKDISSAKCGNNYNECIDSVLDGNSSLENDPVTHLSYWKWECKDNIGTKSCSKEVTAGVCGIEINKCAKGTPSDPKVVGDQNTWMCNGSAEVTSSDDYYCSLPRIVNGKCFGENSKIINKCEAGTVTGYEEKDGFYQWGCKGSSNGGTTAICKVSIGKDMYGKFTGGKPCTVGIDKKECPSTISWSVSNTEKENSTTILSNNTEVATGDTGTYIANIPAGNNVQLQLLSNGILLDVINISSSCIAGTNNVNGTCITPVNGGWSEWSACSATCDGVMSRSCTNPFPKAGGTWCEGTNMFAYTQQKQCGGACPTDPNMAISGPVEIDVNTSASFKVKYTDPKDEEIRYNIDWDNNKSTIEEYIPGITTFTKSGTEKIISRTWNSVGTYTFNISAFPYVTKVPSPWSHWTINVVASSATLKADPSEVLSGRPVVLTWAAEGEYCTSNFFQGTKGTSGQLTVNPTKNTIYAIACPNKTKTKTATASTSVKIIGDDGDLCLLDDGIQTFDDLPCKNNDGDTTIVLIATTPTISLGANATLNWFNKDGGQCTLTNNKDGKYAKSIDTNSFKGSLLVTPKSTTIYTLTCGSKTATATVSIKGKTYIEV